MNMIILPKLDYAYDALTIPANLAEICAISMPAGKSRGSAESKHSIQDSK